MADREVLRTRLIDTSIDVLLDHEPLDMDECSCGWKHDRDSVTSHISGLIIDAALALRSPCQACGGTDGLVYPDGPESAEFCPDHRSPVPVVVEYLMEQVGGWCELHGLCEANNADGPGGRTPFSFPENTPVWVYKENRDQ